MRAQKKGKVLEYKNKENRSKESKSNKKNIVNKKTNRKNNKKIKNKKSAKKFFNTFVFLLVLAGLAYGIYYLLTSTTFKISKINVEGNKRYTPEQIVDSSYIKLNNNIFLMKKTKKEQAIKTLPFVKDAKVKRKLPNTIDIYVTERKSEYLAYDKDSNKYYRLDSDGVILESIPFDQKNNEELLTYGITFDDNVVPGSKINDADVSKLAIYQKIYNQIQKSSINLPITKLNFENSLTTILLNDKLSIILPNDTNLEYNINFLSNIIKNIGADSAGVIDMTKSNPTFSKL